jgi:two-component system, NtrC family, sensor histidine kinase PilS
VAAAAINTNLALRSPIGAKLVPREFYFFNLFRVLEAAIIIGLMFSPFAVEWVSIVHPTLGRITAIAYLLFALIALSVGTRSVDHHRTWVDVSLVIDIAVVGLAMFSIYRQFNSLAMLLLVNIGGGATLLPRRMSFFFAALATVGVFAQCIAGNVFNHDDRAILEAAICGLAYFSVTALCIFLGRRMRESDALASRRGSDLRNLSQINELIIRRMKTGVLVVDDANIVHRWNEAAWALLGNPSDVQHDLGRLSPELSRRLYHWRTSNKIDNTSVTLAENAPEVIPRFTRMSVHDDGNVLIFLDDTSLVSRRAEQLTLNSLGRLSASIAHEIRNPLAAISYSAQLLAESDKLTSADQRMVEIIRNHTGRVNEIVENILHLARRERSMPESLDLVSWATRFVDDYKSGNDVSPNAISVMPQVATVETLADPQQLQQVVWNLVQNAMRYGRLPNQPARVSVVVRKSTDRGLPVLEVVDRGPGIPTKVAAQIFEPFFTTHEFGTGLGLYLARQMCEANQAVLEYSAVAGGGSCFRITLPAPPTSRAAR